MGKLCQGIWGGYSGRIGNVISYQWRGRWCARTRPAAFHDARTPKQLEQRSRFRQTLHLASRVKQVLQLGLRQVSLAHHMTECNYFMKVNNPCFTLEEGRLKVDYENFVFSEGPVAPVAFMAPELVDERTLKIEFEKNPLHKAAQSDDRVYVLLHCPELDAFMLSLPVYRRSKALTVELPEHWVGKSLHLWGFVVDSVGRSSMTLYIGEGECAESETDGAESAEEPTGNSEYSEYSEYSDCSVYTDSTATVEAEGPPGGLFPIRGNVPL